MNTQVRAVTALTMVLAGGVLAGQGLPKSAATSVQEREQATRLIARQLGSRLPELGLGLADGLKPAHAWVDGQGRTVARFQQTHQGRRVFGADLVATLAPGGAVETRGRSLETGIALADAPTLTEEQARRASHRNLLPSGPYDGQPAVELVVFPTRFTGGLKPRVDAAGSVTWDREGSVLAHRPAATHVWAYEVVSLLNNAEDGVQELHTVVDARTGDVLRKWDAMPTFRARTRAHGLRSYGDLERAKGPLKIAPSALTASAGQVAASAGASAPAVGTGLSQYSGTVAIGTSTNPGGGFDLRDQTRAMNPANPNSVWLTTGIVTNYIDLFQPGFVAVAYSMNNLAGSLDNTWGDGQNYLAPPPNQPNDFYTPAAFHWGDANGQTAAVDAHFAATVTYDMYKNVLGRPSLDGADAGIFTVVHYDWLYDNAAWINSLQMMIYGDGSWPYYNGFKSMTTLDIGGHEMSHGVMASTAGLNYWGESGGLNEANSDMMAQAVVAYSKRGPGDPLDKIPAAPVDWALGAANSPDGTAFRFMYKPSLDGTSPDAWFYGMDMLDVHYTSGPGNRFFFFLSEGAGTDPQGTTYSPYLPLGMAGIGLDKAARIWYKALSEQFTSTTNYRDARRGCLAAAAALYGAASAEYAAVENAFAAINVGPAHGQAERPVVWFPDNLVTAGSPLDVMAQGSSYEGVFSRTQIVPANSVLALAVKVDHASDPSVTWKAGIGPDFWSPSGTPMNVTGTNGSFDDQGLFHSPLVAPAWCGVRAFSKQDPLQFGATMVYNVRLDADGDAEQDAQDAGMLALVWSLKPSVVAQIVATPDPEGIGGVDDVSVQLWLEAFKNAFVK